jgi:hypothetical protein
MLIHLTRIAQWATWAAWVAALATSIGCASDPSRGSHAPVALTAAAATIAVDSVPRPLAQRGSEAAGFTDIQGISGLADGAVALADASVPAVYLFGPSGALGASAGRAGSGPGEYRSPQVVGVLADTIVVFDPPQRKLNFYTRAGAFLHASTILEAGGTLTLLRALSSDHLLLQRTSFKGGPSATDLVPAEGQLLRVVVSTGAIDTIAQGTDGLWRGFRWFSWRMVAAADDSTLWYGRGDRAELVQVDLTTRRTKQWSWDAAPRAVTEEDRQGARAYAAIMRAPPNMTAPDRFADSVPIFGRMLHDPTGLIWVPAYARPMAAPDSAWVIDPQAGTISLVRLPARFRPLQVLADRILGVVIDDDGVQVPVGFALTRSPNSVVSGRR